MFYMKSILTICLLLIIPLTAHAGSCTISRKTKIDKPLSKVYDVFDKHEEELIEAGNCEIISRNNETGEIRMKKRIDARQKINLTIKKTLEKEENEFTINMVLVEADEPLEDYEMTIHAKEVGNNTIISVTTYARVDGVSSIQVRVHMARANLVFRKKLIKLCQ